jgi:NAD(P)-dependent dehydrogenase (short-subunit alcohol dehydrogenase family)
MNLFKLKNKKVSMRKVLVTGSNRGIGLEIVKQLARSNNFVFMSCRDLNKGMESLKKIEASLHSNIKLIELDVTKEESIEKALNEIKELDAVINNAGINYDTWQNTLNADLKNVHETFETNFFGVWRVCQKAVPLLKKSKHPRIVNVSSEAGALNSMEGGAPGYCSSKAALNALTICLASDLKKDHILVNSICPGWIATDMGGSGGGPVSEGAKSVLWALDLKDNGPTGGFFRQGQRLDW